MIQPKIEVIFFDAAGTLFDVRGSVGEIYANLAAKYGKNLAPEKLQQNFIRAFRQQPPLAFPPATPKNELPALEFNWWRKLVLDVFSEFGAFPDFDYYFVEVFEFFRTAQAWQLADDVQTTLQALQERGVKIGLISNFDTRIYDVLREFELLDYFDSIHISSEVGAAKPAPQIFHAALTAHQINASQAMHIGDDVRDDVQGAEAVGMTGILLKRQPNQGEHTWANQVSALRMILSYL